MSFFELKKIKFPRNFDFVLDSLPYNVKDMEKYELMTLVATMAMNEVNKYNTDAGFYGENVVQSYEQQNHDYILQFTQFCNPDCSHLKMNEQEQNNTIDGKSKAHWCNRFNTQVKHNNAHPNLYRCDKCCGRNVND